MLSGPPWALVTVRAYGSKVMDEMPELLAGNCSELYSRLLLFTHGVSLDIDQPYANQSWSCSYKNSPNQTAMPGSLQTETQATTHQLIGSHQ